MPNPEQELQEAGRTFLAELGEGMISPSRLVNPLLHLWSLAAASRPEAAGEFEAFLAVLMSRNLVAPSEVVAVVERALAAPEPAGESSA